MISNSFHSSAKSHSISSAGALAKAERHNDRGYFSFYYDESKIAQLVGNSGTLAADVENAINEIFDPYVAEYNDRQKRADRKIRTSAFEYFCAQKKLDIATEAIFQIGDKEFWSQWRTDTVVRRNGKEVVLKSFPDEIKTVMNEVLSRQVKAYEEIYQTHGAEIARRIRAAYESAATAVQSAEQLHQGFADLYAVPSKLRAELIGNLDPADQISYAEYAAARDTLAAIVKHNILERAEAGQMHIKVVTSTGHYDEFSPHAHTIGLAWSDGYKTGLSSRVSKSVVLNKWALEVIQERLNEIAREEIAKHPEIFAGEEIKPTEKGRTMNYTTEQLTRKHLAELEERVHGQERAIEQKQAQLGRLDDNLKAAWDGLADAQRDRKDLLDEIENLRQTVGTIQNLDQYHLEADELEEEVILQEHNVADIEALESFAARRHRNEAKIHADRLREAFKGSVEFMKRMLIRLFRFEEVSRMEPAQKRSPGLLERIKNAENRVDRGGDNNRFSGPSRSSSDDGRGNP